MKSLCIVLALALVVAGCGQGEDGADSTGSDEAAVLRAIDEASRTFVAGDYRRTCSYYTASAQQELVASIGAKDCVDAWTLTERFMRKSLTPQQYEAVTTYIAEAAEVDGDRATATYGEPPEGLPPLLGATEGTTVELRKLNGLWRIDSFPD